MTWVWSAGFRMGTGASDSGGDLSPPAQLDTLTRVTLEEMREALGLAADAWLWPALAWAWRPGTRRFARRIAAYDQMVGRHGLRKAAGWALEGLVERVEVEGLWHVPTDGPLLVASNHPGLADSLALFASLPRDDLRVLATSRPFLTALPHTSRHMLYLPEGALQRAPRAVGVARETAAHLRNGGAVLLYAGGEIEPDPDVLPGAAEALGRWSESIGLFARLAPDTWVLPTLVSGVLSPSAQRLPLTHVRRARKDRERLAAMLQVALPPFQRVTVRVRFGTPLSPRALRSHGNSAEAITRVVVERVRALMPERARTQGRGDTETRGRAPSPPGRESG